jgi:hypothetical protein
MDVLERLRAEGRVIKSAPFAFLVFLVIGGSVGYLASSWYYSKEITDKGGEIGRYRVALGIDKASEGSLIELNNAELEAKALSTSLKLENLCSRYQKRITEIQEQKAEGKIDDKGMLDRQKAIDSELSYEFVQNLRADSFNVDNELRRRLGPQAVAAIVGITPSVVADDGTRVDITTLVLSAGGMPRFNMDFTCPLANGIEQMAKLLPPDSQKP